MPNPRAAVALTLALASGFGLWAGVTEARSGSTFGYPLEEVYSTAVRYIRIDRECTITERDPQAAYLLFECPQKRRGALELYPVQEGVRAQLTLSEEPRYMEDRFLTLLGRKLREERGDPRPPRREPEHKRPQPAPPDGGADLHAP